MHTDTVPGTLPVPSTVLAELKTRHAEPHRAYHDWSHIAALLSLFGEVSDRLHDACAVELAILFHDAIYDPRATDNEERSARWMETCMTDIVDPETLARAAMLVRATARHLLPDADAATRSDAAFFLDMDLSILAAPDERFERYDVAIRREYAHVPDPVFAEARARILAAFLDRPRLFLSDWGHDRFERAARDNLRRSLQRLSATHQGSA